MRRGILFSENFYRDHNETAKTHQHQITSAANTSTKKSRKIKNLKNETRQSVRTRSQSPTSKIQTEVSRTYAISPGTRATVPKGKLPLEKLYKIYSKILCQLELVKTFTKKKKNETDNLIDLRKQLQRADEFSIRFSRNNLYETKRIISEIKKQASAHPFDNTSTKSCKSLYKKIILAYQAASQALQTYINYAKNPFNLEVPEKIAELIPLISDLILYCENLSLPKHEYHNQNDGIALCNELTNLLRAKPLVYDYVELIEADLGKKKPVTVGEDVKFMNKFFMYKSKFTPKLKFEQSKKKFGVPTFMDYKNRKMKKKDEKNAKLTHEIYTRRLNPCRGGKFGGKVVKFESEYDGKGENMLNKKFRKSRYVTPREVRSQDDDVETIVQTIGCDDINTSRPDSTIKEVDEMSDGSTNLNKNTFKELLLEAIEGLENSESKDSKATLKKLLESIQSRAKDQIEAPNNDRVKVFHFLSDDMLQEIQEESKIDEEVPEDESVKSTEKKPVSRKNSNEKLKLALFKPLPAKNAEDSTEEVTSGGRVKLRIPESMIKNVTQYKKEFSEYTKNNIMYKKTLANKPWDLIEKISDRIILDLVEEISMDFQNDVLLRRLYLNELLEVLS